MRQKRPEDASSSVADPSSPRLGSLPAGGVNLQVLMLALPLLGEQAGVFAIGLFDTWLAGRISAEATTAVGVATYLSWMLNALIAIAATGAVALIARSVGAGKQSYANWVANQALTLAIGVGVVAAATAYLIAPAMASSVTRSEAAQDAFITYIRIDAFGYLAWVPTYALLATLKASGDTRTPMLVMLVVNAFNALISAALVYGWFGVEMGVAGIAMGTTVARTFSFLLLMPVFMARPRGFFLNWGLLRPKIPILKRLLWISLPAGVERGIMSVTQWAFLVIVGWVAWGDSELLRKVGPDAMASATLAAHTIAMRLEGLGYLPAFAWGMAASTCVGQYLGAGDKQRSMAAGKAAAIQVGLACTAIGASFALFAQPIFTLMHTDPLVREIGVPAFRLLGLVQPFLGIAVCMTYTLRNVGDTRMTMLFTFIASIGLRLPLAWLFGIYLEGGLVGAWLGMWADNLAKFVLSSWRFLHGGWQSRRI